MLSTVSPRTADPALRVTLIETAARLIAEHGTDALTLRRLASEVGASTMAIYTHFGGWARSASPCAAWASPAWQRTYRASKRAATRWPT